MEPHTVDIEESADGALNLVARQAELWGADWQKVDSTTGKLGLPVSAGLRRGWVEGTVRIESTGETRSRIAFEPENDDYRVDRGSVMILIAAGIGCLITIFAMYIPRLIPLIPIGILLAIGAYIVVIARLRNSGPEEFFEAVVDDTE